MRYSSFLLLCSLCLCAQDLDRDGLDDAFEDELLARFAPSFFVSAADCDLRPATFAADELVPRAVARDGRIYGQVFRNGSHIEIHYYHLWSRDCGRGGHPFDPEHVSVLLQAPDWRAVYWYAAAHEGTLCNTSQAAMASTLDAEERGARIWISSGKHGSFLSAESCRGGCGADRCEQMIALARTPVVNLGERGAPLNGAVWAAAPEWALASKMGSDFPQMRIDQLAGAPGITRVERPPGPIQSVIAYSADPMSGAATGRDQTRSAVTGANESVHRSVKQADQAVRKWLQKIPH